MKTRTRIESNDAWKQYLENITKLIGERLSRSKLRQYVELMKLYRSRRIEADELSGSLLVLFEEDECLSQMFNELMEEEIGELNKNEAREPIAAIEERAEREGMEKEVNQRNNDEVEEGAIQEAEHRRCRVRLRCDIGRDEADKPIKKRSKYRLEPSGPVLGPHEFKSEINRNCGNVDVEGDFDGGAKRKQIIFTFSSIC